MTLRVDMYLLRDGSGDSAALVCQLVGKAWPAHRAVQLACRDRQQCSQLDQLLWQLPKGRFIGHSVSDGNTDKNTPVLISTQTRPAHNDTVLVEWRSAATIAGNCGEFARILDIVDNSDSARAAARERYKAYRQLTTELHTHELPRN